MSTAGIRLYEYVEKEAFFGIVNWNLDNMEFICQVFFSLGPDGEFDWNLLSNFD